MPALVDSSVVVGEWLRVAVTPDTLGTLNANISAAATSIVLAGGFDTLAAGVRVVKINNELMPVTQSGATLTVEGNGRGYFGGTAAAHIAGDTVYIANLNAIVGNAVYEFAAPEGWKNATPALVYSDVGGSPEDLRGASGRDTFEKPRISFKCFGGRDSKGNYPAIAPNLVYMALGERLMEVVNTAESTASGAIMSTRRDSSGQPVIDDTVKPSWPFRLTFANFEIRTLT